LAEATLTLILQNESDRGEERKSRGFPAWIKALALLFAAAAPSSCLAGGGPENVLLLVNSNSDASKTIANHYIELRKIPPSNVVYIDWKGSLGECQGKNFREQILLPAIDVLEKRKLTPQIDYLVYSSDFPWKIQLKSIYPNEEFKAPFDPIASLTGASYLTPFVTNQNPAIVMPSVNWYVPAPIDPNIVACQKLENVPTRGFRARYLWDQNGKHTTSEKTGQRYLLSTALGITRGRGNTVEEVIAYLRRAKAADGTKPRGTMYFMWNKDVRSSARHKCFATVAAQVNRAGVRTAVQQGRLPNGAKDVIGLMAGIEKFDLTSAGIAIQPGAICEHLTSAGGVMAAGAHQTPLSEFLRHGAAGASGTVTEPRAIQAKFPLPSLQLHYARGCSLAESFYQSVSGPYQLLIVGDPLCQPWATFPGVTVTGIEKPDDVKGTLSLTPSGTPASGKLMGAYEIFVDGRLVVRTEPGKTVALDTTKLADGYHELRIVGIHGDAIETQGRAIVPIVVNNHGRTLQMDVSPRAGVSSLSKVKVRVSQSGAKVISVRQNSREVGRVNGESGEVEIAASVLGRGPTKLQAFSEGDAVAVSRPVQLQVN
jgi:uncharacterized protein (TIGR03790 family)